MWMTEDPRISIVRVDLAQKSLEMRPQTKQRTYFSTWVRNALETVQAHGPTTVRGAAPAPNDPYDYRYTIRYQCSEEELQHTLAAFGYDGS